VSRVLTELGHEVIVAHAQKVRLIVKSRRKDDRLDARTLARLARIDPELLSPVQHRSAQARAGLVSARTALVNAARGLVKSYGEQLRKCGTQQVSREPTSGLSAGLRELCWGGTGWCTNAEVTRLHRLVALKFLSGELAYDRIRRL
jgi:hypothetical protein